MAKKTPEELHTSKILAATLRRSPNVLALWLDELRVHLEVASSATPISISEGYGRRYDSEQWQGIAGKMDNLCEVCEAYARLYPSTIADDVFVVLASIAAKLKPIIAGDSESIHNILNLSDGERADRARGTVVEISASYAMALSKLADRARGYDLQHGAPSPAIAIGKASSIELAEAAREINTAAKAGTVPTAADFTPQKGERRLLELLATEHLGMRIDDIAERLGVTNRSVQRYAARLIENRFIDTTAGNYKATQKGLNLSS